MKNVAFASNLFTQESSSARKDVYGVDSATPQLQVEDAPLELHARLLDYSSDYAQWIRLISLRVMTSSLGWKIMSSPGIAPGADLASMAGLLNLSEIVTTQGAALARTAVMTILQNIESSLPCPIIFSEKLNSNLAELGKIVGLNAIEEAVLGLAILFHAEPAVMAIEEFLGLDVQANAVPGIFASALGFSIAEVKQAFSTSSRLSTSGLLSLDINNNSTCLSLHLDLISKSFAARMLHGEPMSKVFGSMVRPAPTSSLNLEDYDHIQKSLNLAIACLRNWSPASNEPLTILFYGPAGSGKTSLARLLAQYSDFHANEIPEMNEDGSPMSPSRRARACRLAQAIFENARELLILDECEEVILAQERDSGEKITKSWINQFLESKATPSIFVCNSVADFDPATLRRFSLCIHIPIPPRATRIKIIERSCDGRLPDETVQAMADHPKLSPAIIAKAGKIATTISGQLGSAEDLQNAALLVMNQHLEAAGSRPIVISKERGVRFDPRLIRANVDIHGLLTGLMASKNKGPVRSTLLMSGCAGTGKTSLGKWLANELEMPLTLIKASDLKSPYSGQTEINIRNALERAKRDGAIIQVDEIDSFLAPREKATQSFQISETNEFLTALDDFHGVLIGTCNNVTEDRLDPACQRRFDLHIRFDYPDQAMVRDLYMRHAEMLGLDVPDEKHLFSLDTIDCLTPGDFAQIHRRSQLVPIKSHGDFLAQIKACAEWKPGHTRRIGF